MVVFTRDRDGEVARGEAIEEGILQAPREFPDAPRMAGGVAIEEVESWMLALAGKVRSQLMGEKQRKKALVELGIGEKSTMDMVRLIEKANLEDLPGDAESLRTWLERVRAALNPDNT